MLTVKVDVLGESTFAFYQVLSVIKLFIDKTMISSFDVITSGMLSRRKLNVLPLEAVCHCLKKAIEFKG